MFAGLGPWRVKVQDSESGGGQGGDCGFIFLLRANLLDCRLRSHGDGCSAKLSVAVNRESFGRSGIKTMAKIAKMEVCYTRKGEPVVI